MGLECYAGMLSRLSKLRLDQEDKVMWTTWRDFMCVINDSLTHPAISRSLFKF